MAVQIGIETMDVIPYEQFLEETAYPNGATPAEQIATFIPELRILQAQGDYDRIETLRRIARIMQDNDSHNYRMLLHCITLKWDDGHDDKNELIQICKKILM